MKKLVEEIKDRFCKFLCGGYNYGENRCDCYPRETWGTAQAQCSGLNDTVDFAITRVGKAILSGECADLDKLLGVVGRLEQEPRSSFYGRGVERSLQGWIRNRFKQGARTFIAVKGIGKEEGD